jgi:hypothetical protein
MASAPLTSPSSTALSRAKSSSEVITIYDIELVASFGKLSHLLK